VEDLVIARRLVSFGAVLVVAAALAGCGERVKDPDNELPSGVVDTPKAGAVLRPGKTLVGGWAMDDSGVAEVRLYFDGHFKDSARLNVARPDVGRAIPQYARRGDIYGWNIEADFGMEPGSHTILVQAVDESGATHDIGVIPVSIPK
jgi:hypothetical protein